MRKAAEIEALFPPLSGVMSQRAMAGAELLRVAYLRTARALTVATPDDIDRALGLLAVSYRAALEALEAPSIRVVEEPAFEMVDVEPPPSAEVEDVGASPDDLDSFHGLLEGNGMWSGGRR